MEWSFDGPDGSVAVRQEGECAVCRAMRPTDGGGLYKAWLLCQNGERVLLGTLIPEGGALLLRRSIPVSRLRAQGAWPPAGGEIVMAYSFTETKAPAGWSVEQEPARKMGDPILAQAAGQLHGPLVREDGQGFSLAIPYSEKERFPLLPAFCFARLERLDGRTYVAFHFSQAGFPNFRIEGGPAGDSKGEFN